jgi:hypothetical protein
MPYYHDTMLLIRRYVRVIALGQGFKAVNRHESEGGLRRHKSLATVL